MPQPVARQNDPITGIDMHLVVTASGAPATVPLPFAGKLMSALSTDVFVNDLTVATTDSVAQNQPPHLPPPGASFSKPPSNQGKVVMGSATVLVNNKGIARAGDQVMSCNDPVDLPTSAISSGSTDVLAG
ncbi:PAAR domain-containing protein [Lentzea sp. NPDC005914]|uniref:PAAR domain-containing protein n=1 Tax=Lentzea sp. NPDC005914 TaxID=3154572 RepID=UPI0033C94894